MDTRKLRIEYHLIDKCNLNCKSCSHFCSLVKEEESKTLEQVKRDFAKIYELSNHGDPNLVETVTLHGGEPLLNKEVKSILLYVKSLFKDVNIGLLTNGLLLHKMDDEFFDILRNNQIHLCVSIYPINFDYTKIYDLLYSKNINWSTYTWEIEGTRVFDCKWLHFNHEPGYEERHHQCHWRLTCTQLVDGKIYLCPFMAYFKYFDEEFKGKHPFVLDETDVIDLNKINTWEELQIERDKVPHFCGYCKGLFLSLEKWEITKKDINEWIYDYGKI